MFDRTPYVVMVVILAGAGAYALMRSDPTPSTAVAAPIAAARASASDTASLPPGHPRIGAQNGAQPAMRDDRADPPALAWTAPAGWTTSPSTSSMRLATYRIPRAAGDAEDAELSVVRAGGTTDANIERWIGQFDDTGKNTRTSKVVHGLTVTIVEIHGTFLGGGMSAGAAPPPAHPGWALLAAIVETHGSPYFFKMTGPAKSVVAAHGAFDALVASVTPASP